MKLMIPKNLAWLGRYRIGRRKGVHIKELKFFFSLFYFYEFLEDSVKRPQRKSEWI